MKFCPHCSAFYANEATFCPDDGTELKKTLDPYLGRTIADRYQLVKRLGSGGMSNVYLAHHVMIERLSALKILREDLSKQEVHRQRFLREARAVNRINHPNIVEISDLGEADGVAYLVMEYVDGPSLHQEIDKGVFSWQRAVKIGLQVAAALARAHEMGVVHRDLKPENLLLAKVPEDPVRIPRSSPATRQERDFVKLTDFGIAKLLDEPSVTMSDQLFGTPGYVAPEYLEGATTDPRSDLYSLGVILYEMTTGTLPYDETGGALMSAPLRAPPIPPSRRVADFFPPLEDLILHLLARTPAQRPPDAFAVYDALVMVLRAETAGPSGPPVIVATPSETRISYASQLGVRPDAKTMMEMVITPDVSSPLKLRETGEVLALAASKTTRWYEALRQLESAIEMMGKNNVSEARITRAVDLLAVSQEKLVTLERISKALGEQQDRVDALETEGRSFRADFGRAIDELVRDRSRERAQRDHLSERLVAIRRSTGDEGERDAALWETAVLTAQSGNAEATGEDLTFQINALQRSLHVKNLAHEKEVAEASGALEGSLAAIRHVTGELERLLEDALAIVLEVYSLSGQGPPASTAGTAAPRIWRA